LLDKILGKGRFAPRPQDLGRLPICISLVVWGERYTDFFLEFCLPSLLADGNLPVLRRRTGSAFIIHTSAADAKRIRASDSLVVASAFVDVDLRIVDISAVLPHEMLSHCHQDAIRTADGRGWPTVFLSPDTIWSNNAFKAIDLALSSGKRVLFMPNVRAVKEDALELLRKLPRGGRIDVSPRELMTIAIRHLHPTIEEHIVARGRGERLLPSALLWENSRGDLLGHFFHVHPLMVFPNVRFAEFCQTIDGDFVQLACPDSKDHQTILDSDEATAVEFSVRSQFIAGVTDKEDARSVVRWARRGATTVHWRLFSQRVRLHAAPIRESEWEDVERQADLFVSKMFRLKHWWRPDALLEDPGWVVAHYIALPGHAIVALGIFVASAIAVVSEIAFPAVLNSGGMDFGVREKMFRRRHDMRARLFRARLAIEEKRFRIRHAIVHSIRSIWIQGAVKLKRAVLWSIAKAFGISINDAASRIRRLRGLEPLDVEKPS
jgi:hypothetical protein